MAISSSYFVDIKSTFVQDRAGRDFCGLVMSKGTAKTGGGTLPTSYDAFNVVEVSATSYSDLFDSDAPEYAFAQNYFGVMNPDGGSPSKLKFMKMQVAASATAVGTVIGGEGVTAVSIPTPSVFSDACGAISGTYVFVREGTGESAKWLLNGAEVNLTTYGITLTGTPQTGDSFKVVFTAATTADTAKEALIKAIDKDADFGSFTFLSGATTGVSNATQLKDAATYNKGLNVQYRMVVDVSKTISTPAKANYYTNYVQESSGSVTGDLWDISGLTLCIGCSFQTMARLSATDFENGQTASDMYKSTDGVSDDDIVDNDTDYAKFNTLRINFIGRVKNHGNVWDWYMRGYNMDGVDTACFDNEMWFKGRIVNDILTLQDNIGKIPADSRGMSLIEVRIQDTITKALENGTILASKEISTSKQSTILAKLGNDTSLLESLLDNGYVVILDIAETDNDDYKIICKIAYLKGDSIRFVDGTNYIA